MLASIGGWQFSPATGRYEFSDNLRKIAGLDADAPIDAESLRKRVVEPYLSRLNEAREALFRDGSPYDMEVEAIGPAGDRCWYRLIGNAELRDGQPSALWLRSGHHHEQADGARIAHLAHHDPLTGLPNREFFRIQLEKAIDDGARTGDRFALLLVDCDNFKTINDISGHDIGDAVLKAIAERLTQTLGPGDTAARLGGDEFAVILHGISNRDSAAERARAALDALKVPIRIGAKAFNISVSIGIAIYPDDDAVASELMKNSDLALYLAKASGRAQVALFSPPLRDRFEAKAMLIEDVWRGIEAGEFELHYEPFCAVDRDRTLVSLTHTAVGLFGSKVVVPGTGLLLSNGMIWFDPEPGRANSIAAGKRALVNMTPFLALRDGAPYLALGAPGGRKIVSAVPQVLSNLIDFGLGPQAAVEAPRLHTEGEAVYADDRLGPRTLGALRRLGHQVVAQTESYATFYFARPQVIQVVDGGLVAGVDHLRPATAMGL
jgi:diguanylate cyclase (GGDEF)-like protein